MGERGLDLPASYKCSLTPMAQAYTLSVNTILQNFGHWIILVVVSDEEEHDLIRSGCGEIGCWLRLFERWSM